jgi:hypothetical protein
MANSTSATAGQTKMMTGIFRDKDNAERAYNSLISRGYKDQDINVMMSDDTRDKNYAAGSDAEHTPLGDKTMEDAGKGAAIGGTIGATLAAIAAIGTSVLLPGLGLLIAGPIAAGLVGAGAGGLTGGLIGALVGQGVPKETAEQYESGIKEGGIVLGVNPKNQSDADYLENEWKRYQGENIYR